MKKQAKDNVLTRGKDECCCESDCGSNSKGHSCSPGCGGALYGLGFVGALIYYISTAPTFWMGVLGVLKAIVWPAMLVYGLMKQFGM
ncbi:MAG: hypothetical protein WC867_02980 [Candidatus Pacearchaeota archaeon]|jgi:hypothetical protein